MNVLTLISFGYLHAPAPEADLTADVRRYLYDPAAWEELLNQDGRDQSVRDFVFRSSLAYDTAGWLSSFASDMVMRSTPFTIAVGCAGGRHRSVAIIEAVAIQLRADGLEVEVVHRDVDKPRLPLHGRRPT